LVNQLRQTVDRLFPELDRVFPSFMTVSCRQFLLKYADPEVVARVSSKRLGEELKRWSNGRFGLDRAQQLIELARQSVGIREGKTAVKAEVKRLLIQLNALREERKVIESEIGSCLKELPGAGLLLTIPGFGPWTVAAILAHTGDLRNYKHPDQLLKMAGLNLYEISSGQHKGRIRITKRGSGLLRRILYMAALKACRKKSVFNQYYERLTQRGSPTTSSLVSVMRKLLRVSWAISNKQESFDPAKLLPTLARAA
jgi:transposase